MITSTYKCGNKIDEVFDRFRVSKSSRYYIKKELYEEGFTERGICFAASYAENKLASFIGDSRFNNIFINEARKIALKPGDPRWKDGKPISDWMYKGGNR